MTTTNNPLLRLPKDNLRNYLMGYSSSNSLIVRTIYIS